jgi:hypothetical protein
MKRLVAVALMAVALFGAMPVLAAEHKHTGMMMDTKEGMRECALQAETISQKISRLETEVAKGEKKYSATQMNNLAQKLKDANKALDDMQKP